MDTHVFEVTPVAALSVTTTLFLELTAALDRTGALSAGELGQNILAAAAEAESASNRTVAAMLRDVGQSLVDQFDAER